MTVEIMCADFSSRGSITLDSASVHQLSNHLAVIIGFVELMSADARPDDPHRSDLMEVRAAAVEVAKLVGHTPRGT
jgi:hypothetical protein